MATADEYEGLPETAGLGTHMAAGALAGISEHVVMYPLDSVKTRMQVLSAPADAAQALRRALTANSARALWRGVWSVILGAGPAHASEPEPEFEHLVLLSPLFGEDEEG